MAVSGELYSLTVLVLEKERFVVLRQETAGLQISSGRHGDEKTPISSENRILVVPQGGAVLPS